MERFRQFYLTLLDQRAAVYLAIVVVAVGLAPAAWTMTTVTASVLVGTCFALYMFAEIYYYKWAYHPGKLIAVYRRPGPLDSMFEALEKAGVTAKVIKQITFESADINGSMNYYGTGKQRLLAAVSENPAMEITVYGQCKSGEIPPSPIPNLTVIPVSKKITRHVNLIETYDDRSFVWLEPFHDVINHKHYFTTGAYLFDVDKSEVSKVKEQYAQLPRC